MGGPDFVGRIGVAASTTGRGSKCWVFCCHSSSHSHPPPNPPNHNNQSNPSIHQIEHEASSSHGGHEHSCSDPACTDPTHNHAHAHSHDHDHGHEHEHGHGCGPECNDPSHDHSHSHAHAAHSHDHDHDHSHDHDHEHSCSDPGCTDPTHDHSHSHSHGKSKALHDDKVSSLSFSVEGEMDLDKINFTMGALLQARGEDLYRMKGILAIKGLPDRYVFQGVHMLFEGTPDRPWREGEKRTSRMVFIGRELDRPTFEEVFTNCLADVDRMPSGQTYEERDAQLAAQREAAGAAGAGAGAGKA